MALTVWRAACLPRRSWWMPEGVDGWMTREWADDGKVEIVWIWKDCETERGSEGKYGAAGVCFHDLDGPLVIDRNGRK